MRLFIFVLLIALVVGLLGPFFWIGAGILGLWLLCNWLYRLGERKGKL